MPRQSFIPPLSPLVGRALLGLALLVSPLFWRLLSLQERSLNGQWQDASGLAGDIAVTLVTLAALLWLRHWRPWLAALGGLGWVALHIVNYEYVRTFDALAQLRYAHYLGDVTFLTGSAMHVTHPGLALLLATATVLAAMWPWQARPQRNIGLPASIVGLTLGLASLSLASDTSVTDWRRHHPVLASLQAMASSTAPAVTLAGSSKPPTALLADTTGAPSIALTGKTPTNVLLIMLEGVTGGYLPSLAEQAELPSEIRMPRLDTLAQDGMLYSQFIAQQRQTNRGSYALLCGDLPRLGSQPASMSDFAMGPASPTCLPDVLSEAGYHSVYLQAAPLSFMMKDTFMAKAGFDEVKGDDAVAHAYQRNGWGVDDKAFLEQGLQEVARLRQQKKPWLLTLLTSGTHHPFNLPPEVAANGSPEQQAFTYLDDAIGDFMKAMRERGWLDDTLVLITSDEAAGMRQLADETARRLTQNWGIMAVHAPQVPARRIDAPYQQSDVALSILDYLGQAERQGLPFLGRSLFRDYPAPRALHMANTYANQVQALTPWSWIVCDENLSECQAHPFTNSPWQLAHDRQRAPDETQVERLRQAVAYSRRPHQPETSGDEGFRLAVPGPRQLPGAHQSRLLTGGQYLTTTGPVAIEGSFRLEVQDRDNVKVEHYLTSARGIVHETALPLLRPGDTLSVHYRIPLAESQTRLENLLRIRALSDDKQGERPGSVTLEDASMRLVTRGWLERWWQNDAPQVTLELQRAATRATNRLALLDPELTRHAECLQPVNATQPHATFKGNGCEPGAMLYANYTHMPQGGQAQVEFNIEVLAGEAEWQLDLVAALGNQAVAHAEPERLQAGDQRHLTLDASVPEGTRHLEARLLLRQASPELEWRLSGAKLTMRD
ncbi:LTA synthase family protein [Halomonas tibetensis]|uniref:LTA synthase family protein n=1 Tax=Halomonas tibetensis TaxID=2259590 RepID=A0ABV7B7V4_9GAMM